MGNRKEYPVPFEPKGLSDAWEATDTFVGACRVMQNLIFDQSHSSILTARPGVTLETSFAGFNTPTGISVHIAIGSVIYGMVSTAATANHDEPFAYDMSTHAFITITGAVAGNTPTTQSTSGDWTPPTMAVIGVKIIVTHPGFSGVGANFFGVIDITNPAAPTWTSANTGTHALPSVPTCVANFNNRAYFACGNVAYYSDVLVPTNMANAGQALTLGDPTPILAFQGLPIQTTSAGVVAGLIAFKSFQIWQITGDAAITGSLSQNYLSLNCGCVSPRSIVQTPTGTIFIATDGPYYLSALGQVLPLTKDFSKLVPDLQLPFQNIANPSRAAASYTGSIYRICLQTVIDGSPAVNDYWFDITDRRWTGPHTFSYDAISTVGNFFVISAFSKGAKLFVSQSLVELNSVYTDNGVAITIQLLSCLLPKTPNINVKQAIESTIELGSAASSTVFTIAALDETFSQITQAPIMTTNAQAVYDGGATYDSGVTYQTPDAPPVKYTVPWPVPLTFNKVAWQITAQSGQAITLGTAYLKYRDCGFTNLRGQLG